MTKNLADDLQRSARQAMTGLTPAPQGEEPGGLPFRRLLAAMFRARYLVFATTLFGVLIGTFLALTTPNSYVSEGKFVFTATGAEGIEVDSTRTKDVSQETITTTATYILNSNDLMMKVVERVTPARILEPYQPGTGHDAGAKGWFYRIQRDYNATKNSEPTAEDALKHLLRTVSLNQPRFTPVLVATCIANNPGLAQEILAAFMEEAVNWHIKQYEDASRYEEAEKSAAQAKVARETANAKLRDFLDLKARVPDFDDEKERLAKADLDAAAAASALRSTATSARTNLTNLSKRLDEKEIPEDRTEMRPVDNVSEAVGGLNERLGQASLELEEMKARLADPNDAQIKAKSAQIAAIKQAIATLRADANAAPLQPVKVPNPDYRLASEERTRLGLQVLQLESQLLYAEEQATRASKEHKAFVAMEPEYMQLRETLLQAVDDDRAAQITWSAAQQKRALGVGRISSLKTIQEATLPLEKEGPNRSKLLLGAFFGGLFLGLGVVILRALPDSIVRTRDDLEKIEGLAVIGVMPRLDGGNLRRHVSLREQGW